MDHEVIPRSCKSCNWLLTSSRNQFGLHQEKKMSKEPWSSKSPKDIFQGLHYPVTWFNMFCGERGKKGALVEKGKGTWQRNDIIIICLINYFFGEKKVKSRK